MGNLEWIQLQKSNIYESNSPWSVVAKITSESEKIREGERVIEKVNHIEIFRIDEIIRVTLNPRSMTFFFEDSLLKFNVSEGHIGKLAAVCERRFGNGLNIHEFYSNMNVEREVIQDN